jgi:Protein of unknown function (DUF2800)
MGISPTASNTDLVLQCPHPFEDTATTDDSPPGEPARWGRAFHLHLLGRMLPNSGAGIDAAAALAKYNLPSHLANELKEGTKKAANALREFMRGGGNPWKVDLTIESAEVPVMIALSPDGSAYTLGADFDEATHTYKLAPQAGTTEDSLMGGTPDYILANGGGKRITLDVKTGDYNPSKYAAPETMGQLLTLAAAFRCGTVAVLHAPRGGPVAIHATDVEMAELRTHVLRLRAALALVGSGFLRTGPGCRWCPAREDCPTQIADRLQKTAALMKAAGGLVPTPSREIDAGAFVEGSRKLEKLMKEGRDLVAERVRSGEIIEVSDGRVLELVARSRRTVSLGGIERALGKVRGLKEIERLEMLGCIEKVEYEELKAK